MKRLRKILLLCGVLTALLCASVRAEDTLYAANGGNLHFDKANGTIMDCDESVIRVVIPAEIKGVAVTAIGDEAFANCKLLTGVKIPEGVMSIGNGAFRNCVSMESAEIPGGLTAIGNEAFAGCRTLSGVTLPDGLTSIGERAFQGCRSVEAFRIPQSVRRIGDGAFLDCDKLERIDAQGENADYSSVDGVLFNGAQTRLLRYPPAKPDASYTVPYDVTYVAEWAFSGCANLKTVAVSATVITIEDGAFWGCGNLTGVSLPKSLTSIGSGAFRDCGSLTEIAIPERVTVIRDGTFSGCVKLREASIPQGVELIRANAFEDCRVLERVEIPNRVTSIGDSAFRGCAGLTEIEIPNGALSVGENAFQNCAKLTFVELPVSVGAIGWDAFADCANLRDVYYAGSQAQWGGIPELAHTGLLSDAVAIHYDSAGPDAPEVKFTSGPLVGKLLLKASDLRGLKEVNVPLTTNAETPLEVTVMTPFYDADGRLVGIGMGAGSVDSATNSVKVSVTDDVSRATDVKLMIFGAKKPLAATFRYHIQA